MYLGNGFRDSQLKLGRKTVKTRSSSRRCRTWRRTLLSLVLLSIFEPYENLLVGRDTPDGLQRRKRAARWSSAVEVHRYTILPGTVLLSSCPVGYSAICYLLEFELCIPTLSLVALRDFCSFSTLPHSLRCIIVARDYACMSSI